MDEMSIYLVNLSKCNEDEQVGAWFTPPIDCEDIIERIGSSEPCEEFAIRKYEFPCELPEYVSIEIINRMYEQIIELDQWIIEYLPRFIEHIGSLEKVVEKKSDIHLFEGCIDMIEVAKYMVDELGMLDEIPGEISMFFDYEAYGRDLQNNGIFIETRYGMCQISI